MGSPRRAMCSESTDGDRNRLVNRMMIERTVQEGIMNALHEIEHAIKHMSCPKCSRAHLNALLSCEGHDKCEVVVRCSDCGYLFLPNTETSTTNHPS